MEMFRIEVTDVIPHGEMNAYSNNENVQFIDVTKRNGTWMNKAGVRRQHISAQSMFNEEAWFNEHPQYDSYSFDNLNMEGPKSSHWLSLINPQGEIEHITSGFIYKNVCGVFFHVKQTGYIENPFNNHLQALQILQQIDDQQFQDGYMLIFDSQQLLQLIEHSTDQQYFYEQLLHEWSDKHYVMLNW